MASPIVKKVLDRLEGERQLKILESNNEIKQPKLWARAKELAEGRHKVYSSDAHGWAIRWYQQKGGVFELDEGVLGAASGAVLGGAVGGPLGAVAGAALGSKVDVLGKKKAKSPAAEEEKDRKDDKLFGSPNKKKDPNAEDKAAKAAKRERLARAIEKDKLDNAKAKIQKEHHQKDADGNEIPHDIEEAKKCGEKRHPRDQKELDKAQEYIKKNPNFGKVSEDKAFNFVRDKLKKKYGSGVLTTGEKPPAPTDAQKKAYKKQQEKIAKERAAEFAKDPSQGRYPPGYSNRGSE